MRRHENVDGGLRREHHFKHHNKHEHEAQPSTGRWVADGERGYVSFTQLSTSATLSS